LLVPLLHIPRDLLHVELDDLPRLGVPDQARAALRELLADLPLVPDASHSAQLLGPRQLTLPCLAVLARHVGQGLRDHNLTLAHDRPRLHLERRKLVFVDAVALAAAAAGGDERAANEAVLFVVDCAPSVLNLFAARDSAGLASFITAPTGFSRLAHWRTVRMGPAPACAGQPGRQPSPDP